jgi:outer membrane protein
MKMNKTILLLTVVVLQAVHALAQDGVLTLNDAIDRALKEGFQIEIARNDLEIAQNNNHAGNAGMLPSVRLNVSENPSMTNIHQELVNGTVIKSNNVGAHAFNANLQIGFTLFDGGKMFATRERYRELERMGETNVKATIQNTLSDVIQAYTYAVTQQKYTRVLEELLSVSESRKGLVEAQQASGMANNTDLFLAQLDVDARKQAIASQRVAIKNAIIALNVLLNFPADTTYQLQSELEVNKTLDKATLENQFKNNPEYVFAESQTKVALQMQKEMSAARFPQLGLTAQYGYTLAQSQAGFSLFNQNYGPAGIITLSVPLFSGNVNARNYKNATLEYENAKIEQEQTILSLRSSFEQAWQTYSIALEQVANDEKSVATAEQYVNLMEQRYNLGQSTVVEFREAQRSFEETNYRLISNQYLLKLAETDLLRLTGQMIR